MPRFCRISGPTPTAVLQSLEAFLPTAPFVFFSASTGLDHRALSDMLRASQTRSVGCVSEGRDPEISVAAFSRAVPFRYTALGDEKIKLGREITSGEEKSNAAFDRMLSTGHFDFSGSPYESHVIPELVGAYGVRSVLGIAGSRPESFLASLQNLPQHITTRTGLVATSTVFSTGLEHTMFYNGEIYDTGAVGFGVPDAFATRTTYPAALMPLEGEVRHEITQFRGNIVVSLDGMPAAKVLYDLLPKLNDKNAAFYAQTFSAQGELLFVSQITSGSPSRGPIAFSPAMTLPITAKFLRFMTMTSDHPVNTLKLHADFIAETSNPLILTQNGKSYLSDVPGMDVTVE